MATAEEPTDAGSHRVAAWTVTVVSTLALAFLAGFQVMRGSPRDLAIFSFAALLVVVGAVARRPQVTWPSRALGRIVTGTLGLRAAAVGVLVVAAVVLVAAPREGVAITLVAGALGLLCIPVAWGARDDLPVALRDRPAPRIRPYRRAATGWVLLVVAFGGWQLVAYEPGPTISDLLDPFADLALGRVVFVVVWLLGLGGLAWHALRAGAATGRSG